MQKKGQAFASKRSGNILLLVLHTFLTWLLRSESILSHIFAVLLILFRRIKLCRLPKHRMRNFRH